MQIPTLYELQNKVSINNIQSHFCIPLSKSIHVLVFSIVFISFSYCYSNRFLKHSGLKLQSSPPRLYSLEKAISFVILSQFCLKFDLKLKEKDFMFRKECYCSMTIWCHYQWTRCLLLFQTSWNLLLTNPHVLQEVFCS